MEDCDYEYEYEFEDDDENVQIEDDDDDDGDAHSDRRSQFRYQGELQQQQVDGDNDDIDKGDDVGGGGRVCSRCGRMKDRSWLGDYIDRLENENKQLEQTLDQLSKLLNINLKETKKIHKTKTTTTTTTTTPTPPPPPPPKPTPTSPTTSKEITLYDPSKALELCVVNNVKAQSQEEKNETELLNASHQNFKSELVRRQQQGEERSQKIHEIAVISLQNKIDYVRVSLDNNGVTSDHFYYPSLLLTLDHFTLIKTWLDTPKLTFLFYSNNGLSPPTPPSAPAGPSSPSSTTSSSSPPPIPLFDPTCSVVLLKANGYVFGGTNDFLFTLTNPHDMIPTLFHRNQSSSASAGMTFCDGGRTLMWGDEDMVLHCDTWVGFVSFPQKYKEQYRGGKGSLTFCGQYEFYVQEMEVYLFEKCVREGECVSV